MKKALRKSLSVMLVVVMLVSCWVFTAPKTQAASAGKYRAWVKWQVTDSAKSKTAYFRIGYKKNNGTGDQVANGNGAYFDMKSYTNSYNNDQPYYHYVDCDGYPTGIYMYLDSNSWTDRITYELKEVRVSSTSVTSFSNATTVWSGTMENTSKYEDDEGTRDWGVGVGTPYAASTSISGGSTSINVPTDGTSTNSSNAFTAGTVYDQYGVSWYQDATLSSNKAGGTDFSSNKITVTSNCNRADNYNVTVTASCGSASASKTCEINVFDYIVKFNDWDGTEIKNQTGINYNGSATAPSAPSRDPDANKHYAFDTWDGTYTSLTTGAQTKTVTAKYTDTDHTWAYSEIEGNDDNHTKYCSACSYSTAVAHTYNGTWSKLNDDYHKQTCTVSGCSHVKTAAHSWNNGVITTEPTCTETGIKTYTCSVCNGTKTETVAALDHDWSEYTEILTPTCTEAGSEQRTCDRCKITEARDIPATGHAYYEIYTAPTNGTAGSVCLGCNNGCGKYWSANYEDGAYTPATEYSSVAQAKRNTPASAKVSPPKFNSYYNADINYNYAMRGASLKIAEPFGFTDRLTRQGLRFTASLHVPEGVDYSGDNNIVDFGFIYSQTNNSYVNNNINNLTLDNVDRDVKKIVKMSVKDNNLDKGTFNGSNWTGVTAHADTTLGGTTLTYNLLINVKAYNWSQNYCARAYVVYNYNGHEYTVYDNQFSSRSVEYIARNVIENVGVETPKVINYCQTKIVTPIDEGRNV